MLSGKYRGYDMNLYRSNRHRWIAGVCGGVAENLDWPVWVVRLAAFMMFSITGSFAFFAYIAAIFLLASRDDVAQGRNDFKWKPKGTSDCPFQHKRRHQSGRQRDEGLKEKVFNYGPTPSGHVRELASRLKDLDGRLQTMEGHVTSRKFQFDQELRRS